VVHFRTVAEQALPSTGGTTAAMPTLLALAILLMLAGGLTLRRRYN